MKRISTIVGLCLVAVVAFSAIGAATASATPPTLLLKITLGTYPANFTSTGVGNATLETANGNVVTCKKTDDTGVIGNKTGEEDTTLAHLGKVTILFLECSTTILGHTGPCGNEGSSNMITLSNWEFHFGSTLKKAGEEDSAVPGVLILVPNKTFSFECTEIPIIGKTTITVTGEGVAGILQTTGSPKEQPAVGTKYSALNLVFEKGTAAGSQRFTEFLLPLESNKLMTGLQLKSENSFEKKSENAAQESTDTLEKVENLKKEAAEIEIVTG
jgi:hypothetical protein